MVRGYLGIDNGTQGLSIVLVDPDDLSVLATGEGTYGFVDTKNDAWKEQRVEDWDAAVQQAMAQIHNKYRTEEGKDGRLDILGIGISDQMHGQVLFDKNNKVIGPVRLWCDGRNNEEAQELTELFGAKVPRRSTCARFLWTMRNQPEVAQQTQHMTTPAGWIGYKLTQQFTLGVGDASGMFPMDTSTNNYDETMLQQYDSVRPTHSAIGRTVMPSIKSILPRVAVAGASPPIVLTEEGAAWLGLSSECVGIPVAPPEGDQPAAMAGSLIADPGTVSMSFGTSIVSNTVCDRAFQGVSANVDHFCAADGKPINMVWIQNGTTFFNQTVRLLANGDFRSILPLVLEAPADCDGLLALPFLQDEPGVRVSSPGASIVGFTNDNASPGNVAKAALLGPMYNLKAGNAILDEQGFPRTEIILTGGVTKTPEVGQIVADVFDTRVRVLDSAEEGSAWGAALLVKYQREKIDTIGCNQDTGDEKKDGSDCRAVEAVNTGGQNSQEMTWSQFCRKATAHGQRSQTFEPNAEAVAIYQGCFKRYQALLAAQPIIGNALLRP